MPNSSLLKPQLQCGLPHLWWHDVTHATVGNCENFEKRKLGENGFDTISCCLRASDQCAKTGKKHPRLKMNILSHMIDYSITSFCTTEKQPLFAATRHNTRDVVISHSGCFFYFLSTTRTCSQSSLFIYLFCQELTVYEDSKDDPSREVDIKCSLSLKGTSFWKYETFSWIFLSLNLSDITGRWWHKFTTGSEGEDWWLYRSVAAMSDDIRHSSIQYCSCDVVTGSGGSGVHRQIETSSNCVAAIVFPSHFSVSNHTGELATIIIAVATLQNSECSLMQHYKSSSANTI